MYAEEPKGWEVACKLFTVSIPERCNPGLAVALLSFLEVSGPQGAPRRAWESVVLFFVIQDGCNSESVTLLLVIPEACNRKSVVF